MPNPRETMLLEKRLASVNAEIQYLLKQPKRKRSDLGHVLIVQHNLKKWLKG
jgi:hypothetical protein